jgi:hypothetical protein
VKKVPLFLILCSPATNACALPALIGNFLIALKIFWVQTFFCFYGRSHRQLSTCSHINRIIHISPLSAKKKINMRPLTEEETQAVFKKLAEYTGASLKNIIAPQEDGDRNVFRLSQNRVYVVRLSMANLATSIARDNLLSLGTCLGMYCSLCGVF